MVEKRKKLRTNSNVMQNTFIDQMNREVHLANYPPKRIISLVPSQTELLFDLGLAEEVVGITKFCIHPAAQFRKKTHIGGTKNYKFDLIHSLQPDLIIGNKEENEKEQIEELAQKYPVWMSDIKSITAAYEMINGIGQLTKKESKAINIVQKIQQNFEDFTQQQINQPIRKTAYFIWRKPYMVAGANSFIDKMMALAGFENVFKAEQPYPEIDLKTLQDLNIELVLLSSEPYPFKEKHIQEFQKHCPTAVIKLIDGEVFSWYGSRLLHSAAYFLNLHREINCKE